MYRLLIVEDEEIEREGLRDFIDWNSLGIAIAGAVENGEEALQYILNDKVDILLTDIKLPGISGIELAQKITDIRPKTKVIIVSCMEEFDYVRKALELGAYAYISKPIDSLELKHAINKVVESFINEEKELLQIQRLNKIVEESKPLLKSKFLNNLIFENLKDNIIKENLKYFQIPMMEGEFLVELIEVDSFENVVKKQNIEESNFLIIKILECINNVKTYINTVSFYVSFGIFCIILNSNAKTQDFCYDAMRFAEDIQSNINRLCNIRITVGVGKNVNSICNLKGSYDSAISAINFKFFMGSNQIISYKDTYIRHTKKGNEDIKNIESSILLSIQLCNKANLEKYINAFFDKIEQYDKNSDSYVRNVCINLLAKCSVMLIDMHENYEEIMGSDRDTWDKFFKCDNIFDLKILVSNYFDDLINFLLDKREGYNKKVVDDIIKIVSEKYSMKLTLLDISKEVNFSSNYLSIIFKKETGENFIDYLIKFRMKKARDMLKDTDFKIYQIGNMVGYTNISHFCSVFKDIYGVSPNEYKEKV